MTHRRACGSRKLFCPGPTSPSQASPTRLGLAPTRSPGLRLLQPPRGGEGQGLPQGTGAGAATLPGAVAGDASFAPGTPCLQAQGGSLQSQGTVPGGHTATSFGGITLPSAAFPISVTSDWDPWEHHPSGANPPWSLLPWEG